MPTGTLTSGLRRYHRHLVLTGIDAQPGISRVELADQTGLSGMAINRIVRELIESEFVEETGKLDRDGVPGRPQTGLQVAADGAHVLGLVISAFGHLIDQPTEFTCVCGRNDCLNTTASGWAILARLGKVSSKVIRAEGFEACSDVRRAAG